MITGVNFDITYPTNKYNYCVIWCEIDITRFLQVVVKSD